MGELDMFSRREADRLILDGKVLVDGNPVEVGHKVPSDLGADRIEIIDLHPNNSASSSSNHSDTSNPFTAVILNKPSGYVSGQAEHGHPPAIRLLTPKRLWETEDIRGNKMKSSESNNIYSNYDWKGFAPAGRLDRDSTGLLVFTKNGVLAKKLIGAASSVEKEYIADVELATNPTKRELSINPDFALPSFSSKQERYNLESILKGGGMLLGEERPLKPCPEAQWIEEGQRLRIVLTEGRKHQIRRMCRELLGFHVVGLRRIRIGPIVLRPTKDDRNVDESGLSEGYWRPLRKDEMELMLRQ